MCIYVHKLVIENVFYKIIIIYKIISRSARDARSVLEGFYQVCLEEASLGFRYLYYFRSIG